MISKQYNICTCICIYDEPVRVKKTISPVPPPPPLPKSLNYCITDLTLARPCSSPSLQYPS